MDDPLSASISAIDLLSLGLKAIRYLSDFYVPFRTQHEDIQRVSQQLESLLNPLLNLVGLAYTQPCTSNQYIFVQGSEISITECKEIIFELQSHAQRIQKEPRIDFDSKVVVGRKSSYPFKQSTLFKLSEDIQDLVEQLSIVSETDDLGCDVPHQNPSTTEIPSFGTKPASADSHGHKYGDITVDGYAQVCIGDTIIHNDTKNVEDLVKRSLEHSHDAELRGWLKASDATLEFNSASAKRHKDTGQWLLQSPLFTSWLQQPNSFLWLNGFAGCGKSVLCSSAIHSVSDHLSTCPGTSAFAFFFFTFSDTSKQDASALLRAILIQLCGQVPGLVEDLMQLKTFSKGGTPSLSTLLECLRNVASRSCDIFILLDALDEAPSGPKRNEVLSMIERMRHWRLASLHLLISSRDVHEIRDCIIDNGGQSISLQNAGVQHDISEYVAFQVDNDRYLRNWGVHRQTIKDYLTQHAGGMFRWVECQLRPLRKCPRSEKHLDDCLRALPQTLDETYERILSSLESQELARAVLSLICFASEPLTVDAMIEALAIDIDSLKCYDPRRRLRDGANDLLRVCSELIEIDSDTFEHEASRDTSREVHESAYEPSCMPHSSTGDDLLRVRLSHFSIQEYLLSSRIRQSSASFFALSQPVEHANLSEICLLYIHNRHEKSLQPLCSMWPSRSNALLSYAAQHWHEHYRMAQDRTSEQLTKQAISLLTNRQLSSYWLGNYDPMSPDGRRLELPSCEPSAIYYASLLGLDGCLSHILSTSTPDINARDGGHPTALAAASWAGRATTVRILLDAGAKVDIVGFNFPALISACMRGYDSIAQMLLSKGADPDIIDFHSSPLLEASENGHDAIVQMLLNHGANINLKVNSRDALRVACNLGHTTVVQTLLQNGAHVDIFHREGALRLASRDGFTTIVKMLLDKVEDADYAVCLSGALREASKYGQATTVQMLLDKIVDIKHAIPLDDAMEAACRGGYDTIVQMLFDKAADTKHAILLDDAMEAACRGGYDTIVQMLLDRGVDVNARNTFALRIALKEGHESTVKLLLAAGADCDGGSDRHQSLLQEASALGKEAMVQLLVDHGVDVNSRAKHEQTALMTATKRGYVRIMQILIDGGAKVDASASSRRTALEVASRIGHEQAVQVLVNNGADVNMKLRHGSTALMAAAAEGHIRVIQTLIDNGADVNARSAHGGTPLTHSLQGLRAQRCLIPGRRHIQSSSRRDAVGRYEKIVRLLVDHGANVHLKGWDSIALEVALREHKSKPIAQMPLDAEATFGGDKGSGDGQWTDIEEENDTELMKIARTPKKRRKKKVVPFGGECPTQ